MHLINSLLTVAVLAVTLSSARPLPRTSDVKPSVSLNETSSNATNVTVASTKNKTLKEYSKTTTKKPKSTTKKAKTTGKKVKTTGKKTKASKTPKGAGVKTVTPAATATSSSESLDSVGLLIGNAAKESPAPTAPACTQVGACLYKNPSSATERNELPSGSCLNNTGMYLYMQADGNLVAYKGAKSAIWSTGTASTTGSYVFRYSSSTGNFNMYSGDSIILPGDTWALSAAGQTADSVCLLANGDFGMFKGGLTGTKVVSIVSTGEL
ncbi:hypothetical protein HDU80_001433 [Chytriomyces hyalinus]|nr:hypothetical protein HDU80_001433 [Chytriomyces hyalinus]